ncbi:MAG: hypothetical protein Q9216_005051 [Gyalolechia sp. 2 TL-2023]
MMTDNSTSTSLPPSPISWPPSQYWETAGGWSSFALQIGSPAQIVRVLISTAGYATWVISSLGCPPDFGPSCSEFRGGVFDYNNSESWVQKGFFDLNLETNLYPSDDATFGLDQVGLGFTNATGGPLLENQVVAALSGPQYVLGTFGLGQQPTNLSDFTEPHPSFLTNLYTKNLIPSLSWSYTAGAKYRMKGVFGSLTLGGYDAARFTPSNLSFDLATDISRDLVVGLQSITSTESNDSTHLLLPSSHLTFIDSTVPEIYLPLNACQLFESVFGLVWNTTYEMYIVDDTLHGKLITRNPSFTFEVGNSKIDGPTVEITLPYESFDLSFQPGIDSAPIRYFPLQRAANGSQYTLGRTFLQEAYLTVDYQRGKFSVSPCRFEDPMKQEIVPISSGSSKTTTEPDLDPPSTNASQTATHMGQQKIIGISIGVVSGFMLLLCLLCWPCIKRYRRKFQMTPNTQATISTPKEIQHAFQVEYKQSRSSSKRSTLSLKSLLGFYATSHDAIAEIGTNSWNFLREAPANGRIELPENPAVCELSQGERYATSKDSTSRTRTLHTRLSPTRRLGLVTSSGGHLFTLSGLRVSRTETEKSASTRPVQSHLEKSLPATPTSESPQDSTFPTWARIARHQHEEPEPGPKPLRFPERSFQHRRGFF